MRNETSASMRSRRQIVAFQKKISVITRISEELSRTGFQLHSANQLLSQINSQPNYQRVSQAYFNKIMHFIGFKYQNVANRVPE